MTHRASVQQNPRTGRTDLGPFRALILERTGMRFPPSRRDTLIRSVTVAAGRCGFDDVEEYRHRLSVAGSDSRIWDALIRVLVVNETYFFRDAPQMDALRDHVLPDMDGLEATRRIMAVIPTPILIITAHERAPELNVAFNAMKAGALDVINKGMTVDDDEWKREVLTKVKARARICPRRAGDQRVSKGRNAGGCGRDVPPG